MNQGWLYADWKSKSKEGFLWISPINFSHKHFCRMMRIIISSIPVIKLCLAGSLLLRIQDGANSVHLARVCLSFTWAVVQPRAPAKAHLCCWLHHLLITTSAAVTVAVSSGGRFQPFLAQISSFIFIWAVTLFSIWWTRNFSADLWKNLWGRVDGGLQEQKHLIHHHLVLIMKVSKTA